MSLSFWYLFFVPGLPIAGLLLWMHLTIKKRDKICRRPFNEMPRPAAYSLQLRTAEIMETFMMEMMFTIVVGVASWGIWGKTGSWSVPIMGLAVCVVFCVRTKNRILSYSNHRLGMLGEQLVGQTLDRLSSDHLQVFHDLEVRDPGKKPWNIDHVVLTPNGVFAVETKTRRKPRTADGEVQTDQKAIFDGRTIIFPAPMSSSSQPLSQARNNADWLSKKLTSLNGTHIPVTPVVVLPGWFVQEKGTGPVAVLNPAFLKSFLKTKNAVLSEQQQKAISEQLGERCRIDLSA